MSSGGESGVVAISPAPTGDEVAAILAAIEVAWPRAAPAAVAADPDPTAWRFSGRSWARPLTARRDRPWVVTRP